MLQTSKEDLGQMHKAHVLVCVASLLSSFAELGVLSVTVRPGTLTHANAVRQSGCYGGSSFANLDRSVSAALTVLL